MSDWKKIIEAEFNEPEREGVCSFIVRGNDHDTHEYLTLKEAGAWVPQLLADEPVTLDHKVEFLASLVDVRAELNRRLNWRLLLELIAPDEDATKLSAIYERETGITEDAAFPVHLDPDEPEGWEVAQRENERQTAIRSHYQRLQRQADAAKARRAAEFFATKEVRKARRCVIPRAVPDPASQPGFGFPEVEPPPPVPYKPKNPERPLIEELMRAWLHDGRPSPIQSFTLTGRRGKIAWALVRLFDGGRAVIRFEDVKAVGMAPRMQYHGLNIYYIEDLDRWVRAEDEDTDPVG